MADRFLHQFTVCNQYIRGELDWIAEEQTQLGVSFADFSLQLANLILPHPILPPGDPAVHGTAFGRFFRSYFQIRREERRIRNLRYSIGAYLIDYLELCEDHRDQTLAAVQLTDHAVDTLVQRLNLRFKPITANF